LLLSLQILQEWLLSASAGEGVDGASAELRVDGGFIQWRQSDDDPTWANLVALTDLRGANAEMRRVANEIQWRQSDDDPTWTTLFNLGELGGGGPGTPGASVEMRVDGGFIQWRQSDDDPTWTNLVALTDLRGPEGSSVEMRVNRGSIQWRQSDDDPSWTTLFTLAAVTGPQGPPGTPFIVASGRFNADASTVFELKAMAARQVRAAPGLYFITFDGYVAGTNYIIKGTVINELFNLRHIFEVVEGGRGQEVVEEEFGRGTWETGFLVRVTDTNDEMTALGFMVEVSQF
jgi:hypothetical protein